MRAGEVSNWSNFAIALEPMLVAAKTSGAGLRILTRQITSPTLTQQLRQLLTLYPGARWHQYAPVNRDNATAGAKMAFGRDVQAVYRFDQAKVIVSLDDNFLFDHPGSVRYARDFTNGRRVRNGSRAMNRLYVAESTPSITGAMADHRLSVKPSEIEAIARALRDGSNAGGKGNAWVEAAAKDLKANAGASLVVAGEYQPPVVHAIAHLLNASLGNVGKTVSYIDPIEGDAPNHAESLQSLVDEMNAGKVRTLIILGGNPAYDAPADVKFDKALEALSNDKSHLSAHLSLHNDETSFLTQWHLPLAHELESWGDARAFAADMRWCAITGAPTTARPRIRHSINGGSSASTTDSSTARRRNRRMSQCWPMLRCRRHHHRRVSRPSRSSWSSGPIRAWVTASTPTMAGCRSFQNR
jgi:molybdopterin-containing oxidoreductase family iron-sulfur binding subunit